MNCEQPQPKPYTLSEMREMARCHRSWPKFEPKFKLAQKTNSMLGLLARDAAFSHFLGGCSVQLKDFGKISRKEFIRLLEAANDFGGHIK